MPKEKLKIFMSYAHEDEAMKTELDRALVALKKNKKIEVWQDRQLLAGQEWDKGIKDELLAADIILLLISVDFNNSRYIWEQELAVAMEKQARGEVRVIPVILRTCDWQDMPYAKLQAVPTGGIAVTKIPDRDEAYTDIAIHIRGVVEHMLTH